VLDTAGDDEEFALVELNVAVAELDGEVSREHEEEIVGVVVLVPDELALHFDEADVVVVEACDDLRLPVLVEQAELVGQVDLLVHKTSWSWLAATESSAAGLLSGGVAVRGTLPRRRPNAFAVLRNGVTP
jgi:hypothetical protein